jgi:hypothetical protein
MAQNGSALTSGFATSVGSKADIAIARDDDTRARSMISGSWLLLYPVDLSHFRDAKAGRLCWKMLVL